MVLQNEASMGDHVSERILEKIDPALKKKIMDDFGNRKSEKVVSAIRQRKLNETQLNSPLKKPPKKEKKESELSDLHSLPRFKITKSEMADERNFEDYKRS